MKKLLLLTAIIFISALISQARTVRLADYGTPDDNLDDSTGFQQAVNDLAGSGGGTLVIGEGVWNVDNGINLVNPSNNVTSIRISGNKGATLKLALNEERAFLAIGNGIQAELSGLIVIPKNMGNVYDAGYFLTSAYTGQTIIQNCNFLGLYMKYDLISAGNTDLIIEKSIFGGNAAGGAQVHVKNFGGATIRDSLFLDYYQFQDVFYSKTPLNTGNWVKAENDSMPGVNAMSPKAITISNSRFDEGAVVAIWVKNCPYVDITDTHINVAGVSGGSAVRLDNVKYAQIKLSSFGYSVNERPAVTAVNNSTVEVIGLRFGNGVYFANMERTTKMYMEKCLECAAPGFVRTMGVSTNKPEAPEVKAEAASPVSEEIKGIPGTKKRSL
jgi:hypothetical protein